MQKTEDQYSNHYYNQIEKQEQEQIKYNSLYEFRIIQCYQFSVKRELQVLLSYIKQNKICKTPNEYKKRFDDDVIIQQLQEEENLSSSAIMAESVQIEQIQEISRLNNIKFLTWDSKFSKNFGSKKRQQTIQQLNSVDLVIMDSKEHVKISKFLNNIAQVEVIEEEEQAKYKLYEILNKKTYKTKDISDELDTIVQKLEYVLSRKMSQKYVDFNSNPRKVNVSGVSFQRFILLPGIKRNIQPIYSKCSWIISNVSSIEQHEFIQQGFIGKLLKSQKQTIMQEIIEKITIDVCQLQYQQVQKNTNIQIKGQLNMKKYSLRQLQYRPDLFQKLIQQQQFLGLQFNVLYCQKVTNQTSLTLDSNINENLSDVNPFFESDINLDGVLLNLKFTASQLNVQLSNNICQIIKNKLQEQCSQCLNNDHQTRFVFGCCGISIGVDCLLNNIKYSFQSQRFIDRCLKCPICKLKIIDTSEKMCFFVTLDPKVKGLNDQYQSFEQYQNKIKMNNSDITTIEIVNQFLKPNIIQTFEKKEQRQNQLILFIDQLVPEHLDNISMREFVNYHIKNFIYSELQANNYSDINVCVYTQRENINNIINQM